MNSTSSITQRNRAVSERRSTLRGKGSSRNEPLHQSKKTCIQRGTLRTSGKYQSRIFEESGMSVSSCLWTTTSTWSFWTPAEGKPSPCETALQRSCPPSAAVNVLGDEQPPGTRTSFIEMGETLSLSNLLATSSTTSIIFPKCCFGKALFFRLCTRAKMSLSSSLLSSV